MPVLVGVEVVGLGVFPVGCGMGCTPWGMYKDGAAPLAALAGLYGTDTGRTTGLAGGTPEIQFGKRRNESALTSKQSVQFIRFHMRISMTYLKTTKMSICFERN